MNIYDRVHAITQSFSVGIVDTYHSVGSPPHESVVALVAVNPHDSTDAFCWVGAPEKAGAALAEGLPGFGAGQEILARLIESVPQGPAGMLRVFVFCLEGYGATYLGTTPRAKA